MKQLGGTLTVRLSAPALHRLRQQARAQGSTPSAIVRALLERELRDEPQKTALELSRRWVGRPRTGPVTPGREARTALDDWQPDRRG